MNSIATSPRRFTFTTGYSAIDKVPCRGLTHAAIGVDVTDCRERSPANVMLLPDALEYWQAVRWTVAIPITPDQPLTIEYLWLYRWSPDLRLIGKNILRFHAVFCLVMLISARLSLLKQVFRHGFLTTPGHEMGKSLGNILVRFATQWLALILPVTRNDID